MLVIGVVLLGIAFLVLGYIEHLSFNKGPQESRDYWHKYNDSGDFKPGEGKILTGWMIVVFSLVIIVAVHYSALSHVIRLDSTYDMVFAYTVEETDKVLIVNVKDLEGTLLPVVPEDSRTAAEEIQKQIGDYRDEISNYNHSLYKYTRLGKDPFIGPMIPDPRKDLKPIILK